jgi:hypothetical protein
MTADVREWGTEKGSRAEAQGRGGRKYKRLSAWVFIRRDSLHSRATIESRFGFREDAARLENCRARE